MSFFDKEDPLRALWAGSQTKINVQRLSNAGAFSGVAKFDDEVHKRGEAFFCNGTVSGDGSLRVVRKTVNLRPRSDGSLAWIESTQIANAGPPKFKEAQFHWEGNIIGDEIPAAGLPFHCFSRPFITAGMTNGTWHGHTIKLNILLVLEDNSFVGIAEFTSAPHAGTVFSFKGTIAADGSLRIVRDIGGGGGGGQTAIAGPPRRDSNRFSWQGTTMGDGIPPAGLPFTMLAVEEAKTAALPLGENKPLQRVQIVLRRLICSKTTEEFHDEVYYILGGVDGSGAMVSHRGPDRSQFADADSGTAWDMNDNGDKHDRTLNAVIYEDSLAPGQVATLSFVFMESDGTEPGKIVKAAADLAKTISSNPAVVVAAGIVDFLSGLLPSNPDDVLGAFQVQVRIDGDKPVFSDIVPGDFTHLEAWEETDDGLLFTLRFKEDTGHYLGMFQLQAVR